MDLTTYEGLQAAIASFLNKTNLTASIPGFIALAEAKMRRDITSVGQVDTWAEVEIDENGWQMPCHADEIASISVGNVPVFYTPPERQGELTGGEPRGYTIDGKTLRIFPTGTVTVRVKNAICGLSSSVRCNWILRDHPDAYLYGSLMQAAPFLRDDERIAVWGSLFGDAIKSINKHEIRRQTGGNLRVQAGHTP